MLAADSPVRLAGILDAEPTRRGARLRRLPPWTRQQILDPSLAFVATMPSGCRIEFTSDTTTVEVDALLTHLQLDADPLRPAVFELAVDGEVVASQSFTDGRIIHTDRRTLAIDIIPGAPVTIRFDGLPARSKRIELWLAHTASFELQGFRVDDGASIEAPPASPLRWAHYGSSISQSGEAEVPTGVWPVVAARLAGADLQSFGFAGQCHLDQLVARTIRDLEVDVISLKLGINVINGDTMRERTFIPAAQGFLDTVRDGHPTTPIAVITPIICPVAEDHPGPTMSRATGPVFVVERPAALSVGALTLTRIRTLLSDIVDARRAAGDENIHLVDGFSLFGEADLDDLPDGLHPNAAGYQRMGERFHAIAFGDGGVFGR